MDNTCVSITSLTKMDLVFPYGKMFLDENLTLQERSQAYVDKQRVIYLLEVVEEEAAICRDYCKKSPYKRETFDCLVKACESIYFGRGTQAEANHIRKVIWTSTSDIFDIKIPSSMKYYKAEYKEHRDKLVKAIQELLSRNIT